VRWTERVWPGDTLTVDGEVEREYEDSGQQRVDLALQATNQEGTVVVRGWMTFVVT
jgi:acyl dehydratase